MLHARGLPPAVQRSMSGPGATRGLPEYDHDVPELLAAMQQQDQMIADHKSAREQRARNAANMSPLKPARLPQVRCGGQCQAKGVWCCRLG